MKMTRRGLLDATLAMTVASGRGPSATEIPRRRLGRTGVEVPILGLGGMHIGRAKTEQEGIRLIRAALDAGMTFLDNSWDYNDGESERRMGKALRDGYRQRAFLMTKLDGRDRKTATRQLEESLQRLQVDCVDLLQLHEVIHPDDPDRAFAAGGAIEAMVEARQAGKARFLGFTGHKSPDLHLKMLAYARTHGFRFDAVQLPLNVFDAHYDSFEEKVLPVLLQEGVAALGMKPMGDPFILDTGTASARECLRYSLSLPASVVITGIETQPVLEQALQVGRGFTPLSEKEIESLLARTCAAARGGASERYKTSTHFDSTARHPDWLG